MLHKLLWCGEQRRATAKLGALIIKFRDKKFPFWPQKCVPFLDPRFNTKSYDILTWYSTESVSNVQHNIISGLTPYQTTDLVKAVIWLRFVVDVFWVTMCVCVGGGGDLPKLLRWKQ